jgi:hypothetical protein
MARMRPSFDPTLPKTFALHKLTPQRRKSAQSSPSLRVEIEDFSVG